MYFRGYPWRFHGQSCITMGNRGFAKLCQPPKNGDGASERDVVLHFRALHFKSRKARVVGWVGCFIVCCVCVVHSS